MNVHSQNRPTPRRGRPRLDDKRRRILDAALREFATRGYHGTAVPEVAAGAQVGTGTLYRYFATKEVLVNEVYRDAKARLRAALIDGVDLATVDEAWFLDAWRRLTVFARAEPAAFQFLEMQDHAPYLDDASREVELGVLTPLWMAGLRLHEGIPSPRPLSVDVRMAMVWGAFVGLIKAERLGYLTLDDATLMRAGEQAWRLIAPTEAGRAP
jgi:AcrR family transcriptional regulator